MGMNQLPLFDLEEFFRPHPMIEQMENLRTQFEILREILYQLGYLFEDTSQVIGIPDSDIDKKLNRLTLEFGPLPEALTQFYKIIGSLNFLGTYPDWKGCEYPDPLFVYSIDEAMMALDEWLLYDVDRFGPENARAFRVPIAPDYYHKENVSGGMWYNIVLPTSMSDPALADEWHKTTFFGYLKTCLLWGGFPGLEKSEGHNWPLETLRAAML